MIIKKQSINEISISGTKPVILLPLAIVIFINGCKIFFEDQKRKASDEEENNKESLYYDNDKKSFEKIKWKNIKVGNILKIIQNEEFPADMILLNSSNINGVCYIETKNLDGETNLKLKTSKIELSNYFKNEIEIGQLIKGTVFCDKPDNNIHAFRGLVKLNVDVMNSNNLIRSENGDDKYFGIDLLILNRT